MRFWLTLVIIFFLVRFVLPIVLRWVLKAFVRKQMEKGGFGLHQQPPSGPPPAPGQVRVEYVPPTAPETKKPEGFKGGEYVDFEEVK
jgi:hypothetical protein